MRVIDDWMARIKVSDRTAEELADADDDDD